MKFADFRNDFSVHPINGDLLRLVDEQSIANQIKNLIFIDHYEIPWKPTLGAGIPQTLFENATGDIEYQITNRIKETINKYVNRAKLLDVIVKYDGNNGYNCTIVFQPINQLEPTTLTILLARTR